MILLLTVDAEFGGGKMKLPAVRLHLLWTACRGSGIAALLRTSGTAFTVLKLAGAAYLVSSFQEPAAFARFGMHDASAAKYVLALAAPGVARRRPAPSSTCARVEYGHTFERLRGGERLGR